MCRGPTPNPGNIPGGPAQPAAWADTGILPASTNQPPPDDPGMVKVSVPEARRLLTLATTPMTSTARQLGCAWSRWWRKHQARARYHHYQAGCSKSQPDHDQVTNRDCSTGVNIFADLTPAEMDTLAVVARMRTYAAGELLYSPQNQEEALFILKQGRVRLFRVTAGGRAFTIGIINPGTTSARSC